MQPENKGTWTSSLLSMYFCDGAVISHVGVHREKCKKTEDSYLQRSAVSIVSGKMICSEVIIIVMIITSIAICSTFHINI